MRAGILAWVIVMGCATQKARLATSAANRKSSVAVLPERWVPAPPSDWPGGTREVIAGLRASHAPFEIRLGPTVTEAIAAEESTDPACLEDVACVGRVGVRLRCDRVLVVRIGQLGSTVVVRIGLVDTGHGVQEQVRQRVLQTATSGRVARAVRDLARELGEPFAPRHGSRWYQSTKLWAVVGASVIVVAGTSAYLLQGDEPGRTPDVVVTPP